MMMRLKGFFCISALIWVAVPAHAALFDRGNGLIYDSTQDLTWLQDANYASTSGHDADGMMQWSDAMAWADSLTIQGFDDWRLPITTRYDDPTCTDATGGYIYEHAVNCMGGEFEVLTAEADPFNNSLFENVEDSRYWTATPYRDEAGFYWQWSFIGDGGSIDGPYKTTLRGGNPRYAWAVRDGDVLAPVPVPAAMWLFGSALLGLYGFFRPRRTIDG